MVSWSPNQLLLFSTLTCRIDPAARRCTTGTKTYSRGFANWHCAESHLAFQSQITLDRRSSPRKSARAHNRGKWPLRRSSGTLAAGRREPRASQQTVLQGLPARENGRPPRLRRYPLTRPRTNESRSKQSTGLGGCQKSPQIAGMRTSGPHRCAGAGNHATRAGSRPRKSCSCMPRTSP